MTHGCFPPVTRLCTLGNAWNVVCDTTVAGWHLDSSWDVRTEGYPAGLTDVRYQVPNRLINPVGLPTDVLMAETVRGGGRRPRCGFSTTQKGTSRKVVATGPTALVCPRQQSWRVPLENGEPLLATLEDQVHHGTSAGAAQVQPQRARAGGLVDWLDVLILAATLALLLQQVLVPDLAPWITDQGRDGWYAARVAAGQYPRQGPDAAALLALGPAHYIALGWLWKLGIPNWRVGYVLCGGVALAAVLLVLAHRRFGEFRGAVLGVGLWQAHASLGPVERMPTNPAWMFILAPCALLLISRFPLITTRRSAAALAAGVATLLMLALQAHPTAVLWIPALIVSLWLFAPRLRMSALLTGIISGMTSLLLLMRGWRPALRFLVGLASTRPSSAQMTWWGARLAAWLTLPWRMVSWWFRQGEMGFAALAGGLVQWGLVLLGLGLLLARVVRTRGDQRVFLLVLGMWGAAGMFLALPLKTLAFYYLVGALPVLYLAAGCGLAISRLTALVGAAGLILANVTVFQLNAGMRKTGELVVPPGAFWWTDNPEHFPTLRASLDAVDLVRKQGMGVPCAMGHVHGRLWMGAFVDGGFLASRLLPATSAEPCRDVRVWLGADGQAHLTVLSDVAPGWPPEQRLDEDRGPGHQLRILPFSGSIDIPADGRVRRINVRSSEAPSFLCATASWTPLGFSRWEATLDGHAECRLAGHGEPAWIDVEPLEGGPPGR